MEGERRSSSQRPHSETERTMAEKDFSTTIPGGLYINTQGYYVNADGQFIDSTGRLVEHPVKASGKAVARREEEETPPKAEEKKFIGGEKK